MNSVRLDPQGPFKRDHGFPARLIVSGFYGTNSVKWLTRLTLAETRALGAFTTRWYNDPVLDVVGRETGEATPVWSMAPDSLIVSPGPDETIELSSASREIWGWAFHPVSGRRNAIYNVPVNVRE